MEKIISYKRRIFTGATLALLVAGCTIDSYNNDTTNVRCDEGRTKTELVKNGFASFFVHDQKYSEAVVKVRRNEQGVSVAVEGDITGPPQEFEEDGFTKPIPFADPTSLNVFAANGNWIINVTDNSAVISGTCQGI